MRKETNERNVELGTEKREQKLVTDFLRSVVYSGMKGRGGGWRQWGKVVRTVKPGRLKWRQK